MWLHPYFSTYPHLATNTYFAMQVYAKFSVESHATITQLDIQNNVNG